MSEKIPKGWKWVKLGEVAKYHFSTNKEEKLNKLVLKNLAKLNFWRVKGMSEWKEVKLKTICSDISYGYTASASKEKVGPKFLRITDITSGKINWDTVPYCRISEKDYHKYKLSIGDIVIARTGTLGSSAIIKNDIDAVFASYLIRFRIDEKLADPFFISYVLQSQDFKEYVNAVNSGSVQPGTNARQLGDYELPLPPLPEQKAIAEVLSSIDDKIDLLHRQNKTLEEMAMTLFRKWFIEDVKEDWEEVKLGEYFDLLGGFPFKSKDYSDFGKYKIITIKNVQDGYLDISNSQTIENLPQNIKPYQILEIGDILISLTGNVGRICIVDTNNCLLNQRVAKIVPKNSEWKPFAYFYFKRAEITQILTNLAKGSAQLNLSPIETLKLTDTFPSSERIEKFNKIVQPIFEKILTNKQQIRRLEQLRDTLLPKLMSGEVRIMK